MLGAPVDEDIAAMPGDETRCVPDSGDLSSTWANSRLDLMHRDCQLLIGLLTNAPCEAPALLIAYHLLIYCAAPRADHLFRLAPPAHTAPLAESVDQLLLEIIQRLFSFELDASQADQARWRIRDAGLSLRSRRGAYAAAA